MRRVAAIITGLLLIGVLCIAAGAPATRPASPVDQPTGWFSAKTYELVMRENKQRTVRVRETPKEDRLQVRIVEALTDLEFVKLPAGTIDMPAVGPDGKLDPTRRQTVHVGPLWMATTEVTWQMVLALHSETIYSRPWPADGHSVPTIRPYGSIDHGFGVQGYPVIGSTSTHARFYCEWLSYKTGRKYRLPTEAEWEYACRTGGPPVALSREKRLEVAWVEENAEERPHPVGRKPANAWGLHDMLGNVGEWALGVDGVWVQKGGSWYEPAANATPSFRAPYDPEWQFTDPQEPKHEMWLSDGWHVGFRIVREVD